MAKLVELIETEAKRGMGTHHDPVRVVPQWWTTDGELVVENDPQMAALVRSHRSLFLLCERILLAFQHNEAIDWSGIERVLSEAPRL